VGTESSHVWSLAGSAAQRTPLVDPEGRGWFEDPILYREGNLLMGVLSHEAFAVLRLSVLESVRLSAAGFPSHDSLLRVG
jgi:hypothetical protein